jgi:hypothetical protein
MPLPIFKTRKKSLHIDAGKMGEYVPNPSFFDPYINNKYDKIGDTHGAP